MTGPAEYQLAADDLAVVVADTGRSWKVRSRLTGGRSDPVFLLEFQGEAAVLKVKHGAWWADQLTRTAEVGQRLRVSGYPTPEFLAVGPLDSGRAYLLTAFVDGRPIDNLGGVIGDSILAAVDRHADVDASPVRDWSAMVTLFLNNSTDDNTDLHPDLLPYARRARGLVSLPVPPLPDGGFAHGDFTARNMLSYQGDLVAIVDLEGFGRGTPVIDLVSLLVSATDPELAGAALVDRIVERAIAVAGPDVLRACLAHRILAALATASEDSGQGNDVRPAALLAQRLLRLGSA